MNPQYVSPQQHGMPPNPHGNFPAPGMQQPPPAAQKPQQQFIGQPYPGPQNNPPGYGMMPNHGNAPVPMQPPLNAVMQPGIPPGQPQIQQQHSPMTNSHIQDPSQLIQQQQQKMPMPARPGMTFPNPANVDQISGQMGGMHLNGPAPPSNQQMVMNGPPTQSGRPPSQPEFNPSQSGLPQSQPGMPPGLSGPPQSQPGMPPGLSGPPQSQPGMPPGLSGPPQSQPGMPPGLSGPPQSQPGMPPNLSGPPQSQPGRPPSQLGMASSQPGMPPSQPGMPPSQPGVPPSQPGVPPSQPGMLPIQPGMSPSQPVMPQSHPGSLQPGFPATQPGAPSNLSGIPARHPGIIQNQPGMPSSQSGMPPNPLGMPPSQHGMPPSQHGIPPSQHGMPPNQLGMPPSQHGMPPSQHGMPPSQHGMPPSQHGMPPSQLGMPPSQHGMPPSQHGMPPSQPGMPPSHPGMPPMPGQRMPSVNGGPAPQMNGVLDPNAPRSPMQQRYPLDNAQHLQGGYPPAMPPPRQGAYNQGYPPQAAPFPSGQPSYPQPTQGQSRLDPDQMPSPVQVFMEDQNNKSGLFYTNQKGQVPPLVTTNFTVVDQGNSNPRFIRSTMYNVPETADMLKQSAVPFALVISPMAELYEDEHSPPLVDFGELGPVRCNRCKAYMCPNMKFFDGGRRFNCLLCKASTEVPEQYFQHLDHTGLRVDRFERPELMLGTYDIIATKEYCRDDTLPKPPALIFLIDVSYNNVKSGLVSLLCSQMMNFLTNLPKERGQEKSSLRVGFITYNSSVHFYNIKPNLGQPQMLVVGDVHEMFMPLLDGFLGDVEESQSLIEMLMQQIPTMFADTRETETVLAPAIQAGLEALKAAGCAGKLLVFHSSLPSLEAPGKLKNRDDRKMLGTEKEKTVLTPQNKIYNDLGQDCVQAGCSVDLFIFNNSFIDLPTIGQVARLTGGEVYKYTYFQADLDGERAVADVRTCIRRLCAFDAVMRVRTSAGVRPTDFYGHFFMSNTTDIELASIDPHKAVAVEIKHDDKLSEEDGVIIQAALLYTSLCGQRRIRILNLALKSTNQMADLFRACELDTLMNFFTKQAIFKTLEATPKAIKENYIHRSAQILACYRKNCAAPTSAGQLILPECMKLLPLYTNCMLKSDAVSGGSDMTIDDRWFMMAAATTMDVPSSVVFLYPKLLPLVDLSDDVPVPVRCSSEKMLDDGVYLLDNGIYMFLWLGLAVNPDWVMSVFGVPTTSQVDIEKNRLPVLDNPISEKVRDIIDFVDGSGHRSKRLTIVRQRDKMELVMKHFLVEDKGLDGSASYIDFLCHVHREIRDIIS